MDDKKKLIVVVALVIVVLAVGAFQLTGGGSKSDAPVVEKKPKPKTEATTPEGPKNAEFAASLTMRDPFLAGTLPGSIETPLPVPVETPRPTPQPRPLPGGVPIDLTGVGPLPGAEIGVQPAGTAEPVKVDMFGYTLAGIVLGERPAALFADAAGNQKLVREGSSIDGDARLISISRGRVTVSHRGKTLSITLGGDSSGN